MGFAAVRLPNISHLADFVINNGLSGIDLAVLIEITVNNNVRCNEVIITRVQQPTVRSVS